MPTPLATSRGEAPRGRARAATPQGPMRRAAAEGGGQGQGAGAGMPVFLRRQEPSGGPAELRAAGPAAARSDGAATGPSRTAGVAGASTGLGVGAAAPALAGSTTGTAAGLSSGGPDLLMPEPPAGLSAAEQQRLNSAAAQAASAAAAASAMPSAEQNVAGARAAVAEPQAEANARAAAALSEALGERAAPSPEIEALCARIQEAIRRRRPPDQDALVQFDPQAATQAAGDELNASVQGQSEQVQGNYQQLQQPPSGAPAPPAQPLTPPAGQVESPPIGAQAAVPDPVTPESVSLDADVAVSGNRISEAGMDSEASALITDPANPVSQAREGQVNLSEAAARDPQEVLAEQNAVRDQALGAMQDLQARTLAALQSSRAATAAGVGGGMVRMGGTEAQMRTQASSQAQTIFDGARDQVRSLLEPLPRTALQRWQSGIAVLSSQVEQESEQFNRWKRERYEGVSGAALELVEGVIGLPDWAIDWLNGIEERFGARVCNLLREISVEVNGVIASCEDIIAAANTRIKEVFDALPESLRDWAAGEQAQFSAQLDGLRQEAQNSRDTFNRQLSQEASQAVQSVRERIHTMRQEAGGWVGQISAAIERFAENPARFILEGLLQRLGIDPSAFWGVVNRIGSVIDSIAADPLGFAGTLARAMGQGFSQFFSNVATHISGGFFAWLFSGLGSVGVQIPSDFSLGSLITFFLQLMGITWQRIRGILARYIGEENVALLERAYELIALLIERGPAGIFELLREQLNPQMILDQILSSAVDFMIDALIRAVTPRIIGLFNPAGAILQAIEAIYRILSWLFENAARLFGLVETVVNGAAELIAGNVGGMANAVEGSLARLIAPVIDFLAGYLGVGNLPNQIAETIGGFQEMVLRVIDRVVAWIAQRARGLLRSLGVGGEERDVKVRARERIASLLGEDASVEEATNVLRRVEQELRGEGLVRLIISPRENEGETEYIIDAEASPLRHILRLRSLVTNRRASVQMAVRIKTSSEDAFALRTEARDLRREGMRLSPSFNPIRHFPSRQQGLVNSEVRTHQFPSNDALGREGAFSTVDIERSGGFLTSGGFLIAPAAGSREVELLTWNTQSDHKRESNQGHAEHNFYGWLRTQDASFLSRITEIQLDLHRYSPCDTCCRLLDSLAKFVRGASQNNHVVFTIHWSDLYDKGHMEHQHTTMQGINDLRKEWEGVDGNKLPQGSGNEPANRLHVTPMQ